MEEKIFDRLKESEKNCSAFLKRQGSAATITLMGPTSSAKSTLITEMVHPISNKLIGKNVGDTAQTSLIKTLLMLNGRLDMSDVLVQCVPYQDGEVMLLNFLAILREKIIKAIYDKRDELDEFHVDEELVKKILNPVDRSYHAYDFANEHHLTETLIEILNVICRSIIAEPDDLGDALEARRTPHRHRRD